MALVPLVAALVGVWSSHSLAKPELTHTRLFENHDKTVYRIPALAISTEGTLLAVCNARVGSPRDDCPYIRLPDCNYGTAASVLSVPKEVHGRHFVLFTNPTYNEFGFSVLRDRKRFTTSVSFDDTKTWPLKKLIYAGPSGYSASVMNKDGEFFVLYEKGKHHYRDTGVSIVKFNLEWLLDGKDIKDF